MKRFATFFTWMGLVCMTLLTACQDNLYYTLYQDMPQQTWDSNDSLSFSIPPAEHDMDVAVTLGVRTTSLFPYKDIVVRAELLDGEAVISSLPLHITLYSNSDTSHQGRFLLNDNYSRPQSLHMQAHHHYTLRLTHLMRLNPLDEVQSVGIIVEK